MTHRHHVARRFRRQRQVTEPELTSPFPRSACRPRSQGDVLETVRCPVCGHPLVVRQDCRGPYFFCSCAARGKAA